MTSLTEQLTVKTEISSLSEGESNSLLERTKILGVRVGGELLTKDIIKRAGLVPKYKVEIDSKTLYFSDIYSHYDIRPSTIAYIEDSNGDLVAHTYYLSRSQGVWRYLPGYKLNREGFVEQISKGYSEESVTLPFVLQKVLSDIYKANSIIKLPRDIEPDTVFYGTVMPNYDDRNNLYRKEVYIFPKAIPELYQDSRTAKKEPSKVTLEPNNTPDFSNLLLHWTQETDINGEVSYFVFPSKDGNLNFTFCRDKKGRAWVGSVLPQTTITSTGLGRYWCQGFSLTTPVYEYCFEKADYTGGYGNRELAVYPYVDMYRNYLSKIPVIQAFQENVKNI